MASTDVVSSHQSRGRSRAVPLASKSLRVSPMGCWLKPNWSGLRRRTGVQTSNSENGSGGIRHSSTDGPTAPRAQVSTRSSPGKGPGSLPANSRSTSKSSSGMAPRPMSWSHSRGSLRDVTAASRTVGISNARSVAT